MFEEGPAVSGRLTSRFPVCIKYSCFKRVTEVYVESKREIPSNELYTLGRTGEILPGLIDVEEINRRMSCLRRMPLVDDQLGLF